MIDSTDITIIPAQSGQEASTPSASARLNRELLIDVIENYLKYYAAGEGHTARAKRYDLQHFICFLAGSKARAKEVFVEEWTMQRTKDFVDDRLSRGEAPATVSRRLATIKHFGRTLAERVHGFVNPAREVKSPVVQQTKPHGLTGEEISLLREAAQQYCIEQAHSFTSCRNRMLLEMLLGTGLRADEVRVLVVAQLSESLEWLKNVKTKGRKFRNVYVDTELRDSLFEYLQLRESYLLSKANEYAELGSKERSRFPVFLSAYRANLDDPPSFGLSPKSIWRIISDFGKRASHLADSATIQTGHLHPHRLRHTFAHGLLDSSKDVRLVAQALGHSDVRTTMRYTERTDEEIAKAIENKLAKRKKD